RNDLEYYAVLPFSKTQLVLAFVTVASIFSVPAMLITLWVGGLWLKYTVLITLWVVLVYYSSPPSKGNGSSTSNREIRDSQYHQKTG
ncbi:MAG: hypothetical protein Q8S19_00130, partial [Bacillota bacterium]|nr:hypothetical protein [Bacillota bacterium]